MHKAGKILKELDLPDKSGKLVIFDWMSYEKSRAENLVFLNAAGNVVWTAELPAGNSDCFVGVRLDGETIMANTFSCWLVTLDRNTGKILARQFTK